MADDTINIFGAFRGFEMIFRLISIFIIILLKPLQSQKILRLELEAYAVTTYLKHTDHILGFTYYYKGIFLN